MKLARSIESWRSVIVSPGPPKTTCCVSDDSWQAHAVNRHSVDDVAPPCVPPRPHGSVRPSAMSCAVPKAVPLGASTFRS